MNPKLPRRDLFSAGAIAAGRHRMGDADGGVLELEWRADGHVLMTGPVATSFTGTLDLADYPA